MGANDAAEVAGDEEVGLVDLGVAGVAKECSVGGAEDGGVGIAELALTHLHRCVKYVKCVKEYIYKR